MYLDFRDKVGSYNKHTKTDKSIFFVFTRINTRVVVTFSAASFMVRLLTRKM